MLILINIPVSIRVAIENSVYFISRKPCHISTCSCILVFFSIPIISFIMCVFIITIVRIQLTRIYNIGIIKIRFKRFAVFFKYETIVFFFVKIPYCVIDWWDDFLSFLVYDTPFLVLFFYT